MHHEIRTVGLKQIGASQWEASARSMPVRALLVLFAILLSGCTGSIGTSSRAALPMAAHSQPNVVMIVIDDLGWADVGYGQTTDLLETPNIDRLAQQSMRFDNAYAGAANCAPSRAVLMSGQYGPRHGIYTVSPSARGEAKTRKLIPIRNERGLKPEVITIAETLKTAGYSTGHFGKWHLGADPDTQGFDHNVAGSGMGMTHHYFSPYNLRNIEDGPQDEYLTDRLTDEVNDWVRSQKGAPFFAYVPFYTVHTPFQAPADMIARYRAKGIQNGAEATYAAMVEKMDASVGRILAMLDEEGLARDTIVIFTSDNGGYRMPSFPSPIRAGKGSYYEGGLRVPLLVRWPERIAPGLNHTPIINADFYPTLSTLAQAERPRQVLDGMDLSGLLLGNEAIQNRDLFWHFPVYLQAHNGFIDQAQDPLFRTRPGTAMRSGNWKLIHYFENDDYELYDLANDVRERNNLAATRPEVLRALQQKMDAWRQEIGADVPTQLNPDYDPEFNRLLIAKNSPNWVSLFDGESLDGWRIQGGAHQFSVDDGVITGRAIAGEPNAFLVTEAVYSDFILEADFLSDGSMNSGIIFRANYDPAYREGRLFGYQADIDPSPRGWTGGLFEEALRGWLVPLENGNPCKTSFRRDQWNTMRIEAVGNNLRIYLNGVACVRSSEDNLSSGVIGLQVHGVPPGSRMGKPGDWVSFKNIRILTDQPESFRLP
uniref:sulfatase-like hydrolase/transferase n=1 Tax=uncultured Altererythrobacter sp. TaxID=500840 RepID=UPI00263780A7|nr:sulfatase-like hydrolase/transferase [uncultured Altererythrobacter sp.]